MDNFDSEINELECKRRNAEYQFKRTKIDLKKECWNKKYDLDSARLDQTIKLKEMVEKAINEHKNCKNYHRIDYPDKKEYIMCSCLMILKKELFGDEKDD